MKVQFLGTNYCGWQYQEGLPTIQGELERAIFETTGEHVSCASSGRTDAGVHAIAMPVVFETNTRIISGNIYKAINAYLPTDIRVLSSMEVEGDFHPRFDCVGKTYAYHFYVSNIPLPYLSSTQAYIVPPFNFELARSVLPHFRGKHDWVGFASAKIEVSSTIRTIKRISLSRAGENQYCLRVSGDGFLYNMVRIIAGTIIEVGQGKINSADIPAIIASKDRSRAGKTAPAVGLVLESVDY
ncbi:MAG: tRNA pseudouridine(38-40) synthase TruA [Clostridia bacterium]|nr:tRNA pseudouridine(38-40) synthase TruA [Clostridia bacterium]